MNTDELAHKALLSHLLDADSPEALHAKLSQLLTPTEYEEVVNRLQIIQMLRDGIPQRKIAETLGVGIATVSRGARALKSGTPND